MKKVYRYSICCCAMAMCASSPSKADFWGDVAKVVTAPVTLEPQTTIDVLQGKNPTQATQNTVNAGGNVVTATTNQLQQVHSQIANIPRNVVQNNFGGDWLKTYDILTASQRVQTEMAFTSGRFLGGCLAGAPCSVNQLLAMPLAASLRDAYKIYAPQSSPLPPQVGSILLKVIPAGVVFTARIAIGNTPDFTAPGFLNAGNTWMGSAHAVTIGNVMIFSRPLNYADLSDWNWLLHEMRHTEQYKSFSPDVLESIDGFATDYLQHYNSMENDAQNAANTRQGQLNAICQYGC